MKYVFSVFIITSIVFLCGCLRMESLPDETRINKHGRVSLTATGYIDNNYAAYFPGYNENTKTTALDFVMVLYQPASLPPPKFLFINLDARRIKLTLLQYSNAAAAADFKSFITNNPNILKSDWLEVTDPDIMWYGYRFSRNLPTTAATIKTKMVWPRFKREKGAAFPIGLFFGYYRFKDEPIEWDVGAALFTALTVN